MTSQITGVSAFGPMPTSTLQSYDVSAILNIIHELNTVRNIFVKILAQQSPLTITVIN